MKTVFISWSKTYSGEIAEVLKKYLDLIFKGKVFFFLSKKIKGGETGREEILKNLLKSDMGILILTPENINAPWLLFESGCLHQKNKDTEKKHNPVCPVIFGRKPDKRESPIDQLQYILFNNEESFLNLLEGICGSCDIPFDANFKETIKNEKTNIDYWCDLEKELMPLIEKAKTGHPSDDSGKLKTEAQDEVDLSVSAVFQVKNQAQLDTSAEAVFGDKPLTISNIPERLRLAVQNALPPDYCKKKVFKQGDKTEIATAFLINNTRISNFVAIADIGRERIMLLDRPNCDINLISVENNKLDVFGSVFFENNTLISKLGSSPDFLNASIVKIEEIPGFAFEDNENKDLQRETVIMFGYVVYVSKEDLAKVNENNDITLFNIRDNSKNLTAKAKLALNFLKQKMG